MAKKIMSKPVAKSKAKLTPIGDRVLIELPPKEEKTASGIIIPDTVSDERTESKRGKVVAVGDGKFDDGVRVPMTVAKGDEVIFQWGEKVEMEGKDYYIVSESNILAIVH